AGATSTMTPPTFGPGLKAQSLTDWGKASCHSDSALCYNRGMAKQTFSASLRRAIAESEKSQRTIGRETGIGAPKINRFKDGRGAFSMPNLDLLIECLDLELVPRKRKRT